jgi:uncharacterized protein
VTGPPAQFGRGVMADVSAKLIGIFATNLADMLTAGNGSAPEPAGPEPAMQATAHTNGAAATSVPAATSVLANAPGR